MCWRVSDRFPGHIRSSRRETVSSTCSSGCHLAANGPAIFCLHILRSSALFVVTRACNASGRISRPCDSDYEKEPADGTTNFTLELDIFKRGGFVPVHSLRVVLHLVLELTTASQAEELMRESQGWWPRPPAHQPVRRPLAIFALTCQVLRLECHAIRSTASHGIFQQGGWGCGGGGVGVVGGGLWLGGYGVVWGGGGTCFPRAIPRRHSESNPDN